MAKIRKLDDIVSLCKRRGFIFQSSEIYGGLASCYDYGPLGVELKRNVRNAWWKRMVQMRDDVVGRLCTMHRWWEGVGGGRVCGRRGCRSAILPRDHLVDDGGSIRRISSPRHMAEAGSQRKVCPACGQGSLLTAFWLMFETQMGANVDDTMTLFLRPETAQGIFVNFRNVLDSTRVKIPFGIAQIGKSFRNEVTTKAFIFRTREFEQAELEFFCAPGTDEEWYEYWKAERFAWYTDLGIRRRTCGAGA